MKVSAIILAIVLTSTACMQAKHPEEAANVKDVEELYERTDKMNADMDTKAKELSEQAKISDEEMWAIQDSQASTYRFDSNANGYTHATYTQKTERDEAGIPTRKVWTKEITYTKSPVGKSYRVTYSESKLSKEFQRWIDVKYILNGEVKKDLPLEVQEKYLQELLKDNPYEMPEAF